MVCFLGSGSLLLPFLSLESCAGSAELTRWIIDLHRYAILFISVPGAGTHDTMLLVSPLQHRPGLGCSGTK